MVLIHFKISRRCPPVVDKAAELVTLQRSQIIRNAADDVLVAELLDHPRPVFELPPRRTRQTTWRSCS